MRPHATCAPSPARPRRPLALALALLASLSATALSPAAAYASPDALEPESSLGALHELRVSVGAAGAVQGSFITQPKSELYKVGGAYADVPYSGYGGVGGAAALSVEGAWRFIGLSVGYTHSLDSADGKIDGRALTLSQTTHHIPLTLRVELPSALVRPSLFGGVDWVSVSSPELKQDAVFDVIYSGASASSYRAWIFGLGFDVMLTSALRLPIRLYGIFNPTTRDSLNDALIASPQTNPYPFALRSEWIWQAGISVGVSFDVYQR